MKILFVWTGVTSYMADCWRALQQLPGVELKIIVEQVASGSDFNAAQVLHDLDYTLVQPQTLNLHCRPLFSTSTSFSPDIIFAVGWHSKVVRAVVRDPALRDVPKVCCFDLPWRWKFRCLAARFVLGRFLRHYTAAYVPGKACERYAKWLGFRTIYRGLFSIGMDRFRSSGAGTRKGFLYVGRFAPEKRIDLLVEAYARYRELGGIWSFDLYGKGERRKEKGESAEGQIPNFHPFVQPDELPRIYHDHACLLLASAFDPWPLVALEARTSGCEVIQSDRCGNRLELDTHVVKYGDVEMMAAKMLDVERGAQAGGAVNLDEWDSAAWCERVMKICKEIA